MDKAHLEILIKERIQEKNEQAVHVIETIKGERLRELNFWGFGVSKLPDEIGELNLRAALLNENHLSELPDSFSRLVDIEVLYLQVNNFSEVPPQISGFNKLRELSLAGNHIKMLPEFLFGITSLRRLDIGDNPLEFLPPQVSRLVNLETLFLDNCNLDSLPDELFALPNLSNISVRGNKLPISKEMSERFLSPQQLRSLLAN